MIFANDFLEGTFGERHRLLNELAGRVRRSPVGYYAWRERPASPRATANAMLLAEIHKVHRDSGQRDGSPRVHAALRAQGHGVSRGRIEPLMQRHGIRAIMAPPRRVRTTDSRHSLPVAPNLLGRKFTAEAPWLR